MTTLYGADPEFISYRFGRACDTRRIYPRADYSTRIGIDGAGFTGELRPAPSRTVAGIVGNLASLVGEFRRYGGEFKAGCMPARRPIGGHVHVSGNVLIYAARDTISRWYLDMAAALAEARNDRTGFEHRRNTGYGHGYNIQSSAQYWIEFRAPDSWLTAPGHAFIHFYLLERITARYSTIADFPQQFSGFLLHDGEFALAWDKTIEGTKKAHLSARTMHSHRWPLDGILNSDTLDNLKKRFPRAATAGAAVAQVSRLTTAQILALSERLPEDVRPYVQFYIRPRNNRNGRLTDQARIVTDNPGLYGQGGASYFVSEYPTTGEIELCRSSGRYIVGLPYEVDNLDEMLAEVSAFVSSNI